MMWLPDGRENFKIGLVVLIQYRRVSASHVAVALYRAYYVARVKKTSYTVTKCTI